MGSPFFKDVSDTARFQYKRLCPEAPFRGKPAGHERFGSQRLPLNPFRGINPVNETPEDAPESGLFWCIRIPCLSTKLRERTSDTLGVLD